MKCRGPGADPCMSALATFISVSPCESCLVGQGAVCSWHLPDTLSLEACSFLKRKWKGDVLGESRGVGVAGKSRERGNCGCDIVYERIYFKLTKSNEMQYMRRTWIS